MDLKTIIVKEYLESLTEKDELNQIFPLLLQVRGFNILTKPTENLGLQEYGKDIVAIGKDDDGIKKRFYFELKGGRDRDITESSFYGKDGIQESLSQASYNSFVSAFPKFNELPLKIIIVHNGVIKGNVRDTYEEFVLKLNKTLAEDVTFDRWDISRLTILFSDHLFGPYLLTDANSTKLFNRVLVNLTAFHGVSRDFIQLLDMLFRRNVWRNYRTKVPRKWTMLLESLKLIAFIIYTEAKEHNNLAIAKEYLTHLVLRFWYWILKNKLEEDKNIIKYFNDVFMFFYYVLAEYFERNIKMAHIKDGLFSEIGGRYEQVGYTHRTLEFLQGVCFMIKVERHLKGEFSDEYSKEIAESLENIIRQNNVAARPLIDIHSIPIIDTMNLFIETGQKEKAISYLKNILGYIKYGKEHYDRLPDARNSIESVIKFVVTGDKPIYYSDKTSPLLAVLIEYIAMFDLEQEYYELQRLVKENEIDLGLFIPHHSINSTSMHLVEDKENDLEEQLFSKSVDDGYQVDTKLTKNLNEDLSFEEFKDKMIQRKDEFVYKYRTDNAGFTPLKDLAHQYYKTPYFPDKWRNIT